MYAAESMKIYGPYPSGAGSLQWGDPVRILRHLTFLLDGDPNAVLEKVRSGSPGEQHDALEKLLPAIISAFDVRPFDKVTGEGLTEDDLEGLLDGFIEWLALKKKKAEESPSSYTPTASGPPDFEGIR
jgi:hypothetical protein